MREIQKNTVHDLLERLGFDNKQKKTSTEWTIQGPEGTYSIALLERQGRVSILSETLNWKEESAVAEIRDHLRRLWGRNVRLWHAIQSDGSISLMVEYFMPTPTSKRTEHRFEAGAAVGWTLRTGITDSVLKIYLDDHVVLGTPPSTWLADLSHASIRGFCGKAYRYLKCVSIYEFEVSTAALVIGNFRYTAKPEDVRALCKLIESDSRLSLKFSWDPQKRCWNAMKLVRNDSNNEQAIEPTLHAMESRALASHIEHFDRSLIDRKNDLPELEINNLALQTRRWIRSMSLRDQNDQDTPTTDFSEQNATDNITTLSGKLKFSIDNKSWSEAIKALGSITGKIEIAFGNPAEIPTLALVLPELAGDILRHFDQKTAIIAYERVLLSKNAPRVLQKICQAAKGSSNALEEIHLLERWLQVEKRKPQIQEILEELAALHIKQQDYVSALRKIESLVQLRYTPNLAWAETIQLAATYEHAKRALLILEKMEKLISSAKNGVSDHVSIAISNTIAHIWAKVLNRPDLASDRLLRVVRDQKFSTQKELEEAEKSLEKSGHIEIVEKSRETRWSEMKIQERKTSQALGQRVFEHYGLSRNIKMQFQTAYELIEAGHRAPNLAQTLPAWMSENLPWRKLIDACLQQLEKPTFDRTIIPSLSRISREKLGDHKSAMSFLTTEGQTENLNENDFSYAIDHAILNKDQVTAARILLARMKAHDIDARRIALTLAVKHNVLDDSGEISNILCADWKESGDDSLILQRLRKLIDTNNLGAAVPMISSIIENLGDKPNIESLVVSMLEMMKYNKSKAAPEAAKLLLNFHADQSGNAEEVLHYAIEYLSNLNRLDLARAFLRHLIEQGINPTISNGDIEALFEGDYDLLAKYYFNSMSAPEVNEKSDTSSAFARLALEQFIKSGIWSLDMEVCFAKLIDSNDFSASDLVNLREFDARHGSKRNLVAALILIARKELDGDARIAFCDEAAKIATEKLKDAVLAYEILAECYDGSTDSADIIRIAHAAIPAGRMDHAIQLCLKVISSKDCVSNEQAVMECLDILILDKASRKITSFCCKSLISWCEEMGAKNLLEKIIAFAILNNFASESILQREVIHLIMSGKLNLAVQRVLDAVSHTDQTGESSESLLDGISTELSKENMSAAWAQFLCNLASEDALQKLPTTTQREVLFRYADWLSKLENHRGEALRRFLDLSRDNPADIRLWVPVFVLLEDAGDDERLIHHLENILPKIEENLQALRNQPITPESLKASLGRARARISQRFNPSNSLDLKLRSTKDTLGYAQSNRAERIAAVQSQLLSAIPNISIQENHRSAEIANVIEREKATERVPERAIKHPAAMVGSSALNLSMDSDSFAFAEHHGTISALPTHEEGMVRENPPRDSLGSALRLEKLSEFEIDAVAAGANQSGLTEQPLEEAVQKEAPAQAAKKEDFAPVLDWRMIALLQDCPQDATSRILRMSFDHDTEKHIALQVAAIVTGDFAILDQWKWRIWRSSAEFGYSLNGLSRQIDVGDLPHIKGSLYKFLLMLVPALSRCLKSRLNIEAILRKKNPMSQIVMRRLSADSAVILRTGLRHSIESLAAGRFSFVDTPELMTEVYVDPWSRSIHFSAEYCVNRPPGYLLHRVGFQTFAITAGFSTIVSRESLQEIITQTDFIKKAGSRSALARLKASFSPESTRMLKLLEGIDLTKLLKAQQAAGSLDKARIASVQQELQLQNFRVQLANSLDLIGIFEAITGDDITLLSKERIRSRIEKSPIIRDLMMYATKLNFRSQ